MKNRKTQNIIAVVLIVLGLLAILLQSHIWDWWYEFKQGQDGRPVLAEITSFKSNVQYRLPESLTYFKARQGLQLKGKDTVSTDADSSAVILFKSGLQVELEPNSLIIIEDYGPGKGTLELTFLRGGVKILNEGSGPKLKLSGTGVKKDQALKVNLAALEKPTPTPALEGTSLEDKLAAAKKAKPKKAEKETLPDSYISSVIKNQKTFLNRCYAQHLRLNPDARGRIDTSITIEPDGTISTARVIASTIPDPTLQQCVVSTLQRTRFRSFKGDPIIVNYPINFE